MDAIMMDTLPVYLDAIFLFFLHSEIMVMEAQEVLMKMTAKECVGLTNLKLSRWK